MVPRHLLKDKFHAGQKIALYGKLEGSRSGTALHAPPNSTRFKMIQPTFEILPDANATGEDAEFILLEMGRIVPIYESLGGKTPWGAKLTSRWHRRILWTIFKDLSESTQDPGAPYMATASSSTCVGIGAADLSRAPSPPRPPSPSTKPDAPSSPMASTSAKVGSHKLNSATRSPSLDAQSETLPTNLRTRLHFPTRMEALRDLHFPPAGTSMTDLMSARTPAHRRLIFEEFFYLELGLELKRRRLRERQGTAFVTNDQVREALKQILPFKPTAAQKRVLGEIVHDMRRTQPMRRLLQGDVGSGKTIVAFQAALVAIENGYQVALMAPTEILATQHYLSARKLLSEKISPRTKRPYRVALLTGSLDDKTKRDTRNRIFRGEVDLAIGTHALVEDKVDFANLGLVIVDEQHRFGVQQRFQLMRKPNTGAATQTTLDQPQKRGAPFVTASSSRVGVNEANTATQDRSASSSPSNSGAPFMPTAPSSEWVGDNEANTTKQSPSPSTQDQSASSSPSNSGAPFMPTAPSSEWVGDNEANTTKQSPSPSAQDRSPAPDTYSEPDVLVMTATPIPRTLALTLYGDLEASIIDELPPGRTPIQTRRMPEERSTEVWDFVRKQVAAGRQAYIVYPIIEGAPDDQPELDFAKFDDEASAPSEPNATATSSEPNATAASSEPNATAASSEPNATAASSEPNATATSSEPNATSPLGLEGGFSPLSKPRAKKGFSPGLATNSAPTARSHQSLGQRPRTADLKNPSRAEGPTQPTAPKSSKAKRP